ncbi:MAG: hypothetical protein JST36_07500 [Bacteroidetes bacterium]|nr:hypothetical protein [Bacteroidota bacterium]
MITLQNYDSSVIQIANKPYQKGSVKPIWDNEAETLGLVFLDSGEVITTPHHYSLYGTVIPTHTFGSYSELVGYVTANFFLVSSGSGGPTVPIAAPGVMDTYVPARKIANYPGTQLVYIDLENRNTSRGQPTHGWQMGVLDPGTGEPVFHIDGRYEQITAMLSMTLKSEKAANNPTFFSASCPDQALPNGMMFKLIVKDSGGIFKSYPQVVYRSNMGEYQGLGLPFYENIGFEEKINLQEASSGGVAGFTIGKRIWIQGRINDTQFNPGGYQAMTDAQSCLYAIQNGNKLAFFIRSLGDVHFTGCLFYKQETFTTDLALDFTRHVVQFQGSTATTLTLPDPTLFMPYGVASPGETHKVINMGTVPLSLSRPVYLDATTSITSLSNVYPDNRLEIMSDGTRWIAI